MADLISTLLEETVLLHLHAVVIECGYIFKGRHVLQNTPICIFNFNMPYVNIFPFQFETDVTHGKEM